MPLCFVYIERDNAGYCARYNQILTSCERLSLSRELGFEGGKNIIYSLSTLAAIIAIEEFHFSFAMMMNRYFIN